MELTAALEPHAARLLEDRGEAVGVGELLVVRVQDIHVARAVHPRVPGAFWV